MSTTKWTVPDLLQLSGGYWATCALHAGVKLDLFSALDRSVRTAKELAQLRNIDPRGTAMLLDALTAIGFLEKRGTAYSSTPFSSEFLSRASERYMGHIIMHHPGCRTVRLPPPAGSGGWTGDLRDPPLPRKPRHDRRSL
jgi:hypothetical protein